MTTMLDVGSLKVAGMNHYDINLKVMSGVMNYSATSIEYQE